MKIKKTIINTRIVTGLSLCASITAVLVALNHADTLYKNAELLTISAISVSLLYLILLPIRQSPAKTEPDKNCASVGNLIIQKHYKRTAHFKVQVKEANSPLQVTQTVQAPVDQIDTGCMRTSSKCSSIKLIGTRNKVTQADIPARPAINDKVEKSEDAVNTYRLAQSDDEPNKLHPEVADMSHQTKGIEREGPASPECARILAQQALGPWIHKPY